MTYDHWKTTPPDDGDDRPFGECDCCGKRRPLSHCWYHGIETFACDECRGQDPDEALERKRDYAREDSK